MLITNFKNLTRNPLRKKPFGRASSLRDMALLIAEAGYQALDVKKAVSRKIKLKNNNLSISGAMLKHSTDLNDYKNVFIVGVGKGSALACAALAKILGKRLTAGIVLDVQSKEVRPPKMRSLKILTGAHPLPSKQNVKSTQKIIKLAQKLKKDDLLITFICGGGSALACASRAELKASQTIFKELTKKGADILELNTVRKHLSEIKGGNFAKLAYPASVISLIVSDVPSNDLSIVASGPTALDKTTKKDAEKILKKYQHKSANLSVLITDLRETPKNKKYFKKVRNILFLSNHEPVLAMAKKAKKLGFKPRIYSSTVRGEAKNSLLPMIKKIKSNEAILAAGETTVILRGRPAGKGGRNMEATLGVITNNLITNNLITMSFASDGRDNTEAAGAIADFLTIKKIRKLKLDPKKFLNNNNSFNFFKKTGDLLYAKQKCFNVSDLMLVLKSAKNSK